MRVGYADPPYPGQSAIHYGDHPDYDGEVDHRALLERLTTEFDGWVLHTSAPAPALGLVLGHVHELQIPDVRTMAWVKPFAAFKRNVSVAYAWEPVLVRAVRKPTGARGRHGERTFSSAGPTRPKPFPSS